MQSMGAGAPIGNPNSMESAKAAANARFIAWEAACLHQNKKSIEEPS